MSTYDPKQLLTDYEKGKLTPEMAVGHCLRHIDKLYADQTEVRHETRSELGALKQQVTLVQTTVERLKAIIDKARAKQKLPKPPSQPNPGQP